MQKVHFWFYIYCITVMLIVSIGGYTRLSGAGLSITEWKPISGIMPPISKAQWEHKFELYKKSPEFIYKNFFITLKEFKKIFYIEYIHRVVGRLSGIIVLVSSIYLYFTKQLSKFNIKSLLLVLGFGGIQAIIGWFMVKSGLKEEPNVSHLMLALHLFIASIIFSILVVNITKDFHWFVYRERKIYIYSVLCLITTYIQIIYGAFTAGTHAGLLYPSFPLMDGHFLPNELGNIIQSPGSIMLIHRILAFVILMLAILIRYNTPKELIFARKICNILLISVFTQITLGIVTLLSYINISVALVHQIGAFIVLSCNLIITSSYARKHN
ncbi:MAG: heme A synthase [Candidatus Xenolissoclinum pacificiensis L6]|uniref:Heme A synthase n=1 Tax=Candidatus Xenolissoclinum pacificiensis L6 TaxID=1401685 RepID=W2UYW6_9RICK|nr:MAG: heme A synthase [Candidatus Xenolissoclinum pacificiensis L6]